MWTSKEGDVKVQRRVVKAHSLSRWTTLVVLPLVSSMTRAELFNICLLPSL